MLIEATANQWNTAAYLSSAAEKNPLIKIKIIIFFTDLTEVAGFIAGQTDDYRVKGTETGAWIAGLYEPG